MIAYCGLLCEKCPAYIATQTNDHELLRKTSEHWTKEFGTEFSPSDILCDGCRTESVRKSKYCAECAIRSCCQDRELDNCAYCPEYICDKLQQFFRYAPEAKKLPEQIHQGDLPGA